MKLRTLCLLLSFVFALTACGGGQSGFNNLPANPQSAPRQTMADTGSQGVNTNIIVPIQLAVNIPCADGGAGEDVTLSGNLHILDTVTVTANNLHFTSLANPQGVTGVGSTTGAKYQGTGVTRSDENFANATYPLTFSYVNNFRIIGQGPRNNSMIHETIQVTINANNVVTVDSDHLSIVCQ